MNHQWETSCRSSREPASCRICPPIVPNWMSIVSINKRNSLNQRKVRLTQRFSRRPFLSLRAACNPRGLLARASSSKDQQRQPRHGLRTTYSPFLRSSMATCDMRYWGWRRVAETLFPQLLQLWLLPIRRAPIQAALILTCPNLRSGFKREGVGV